MWYFLLLITCVCWAPWSSPATCHAPPSAVFWQKSPQIQERMDSRGRGRGDSRKKIRKTICVHVIHFSAHSSYLGKLAQIYGDRFTLKCSTAGVKIILPWLRAIDMNEGQPMQMWAMDLCDLPPRPSESRVSCLCVAPCRLPWPCF